MMNSITGGEYILKTLNEYGVKQIFTLVGNHISPVLVHKDKYEIQVVDVRHEQAAIYMADAYAQISRYIGTAFVVGGPGFTNAITGIVKAYMASTPLLVFVGSTVKSQNDTGGLQEMEQLDMIHKYSKWTATINDAERVPEYINRAITIARSGRMGPVVLEIPIDMLKRKAAYPKISFLGMPDNQCDLTNEMAVRIADFIKSAKNPIVLAGDELYYQRAEQEFIRFVEKSNLPVYTIGKGRGCIPDNHRLCFGNGRLLEAGSILKALEKSDVLFIVGVYSDYQMNSFKGRLFDNKKAVIRICMEPHSDNFRSGSEVINISCNINQGLKKLNQFFSEKDTILHTQWIDELKEQHIRYFDQLMKKSINNITNKIQPYRLITKLMEKLPEDSILVIDGSNAMFWMSLLYQAKTPGQVIIGPDGTLGPMGCGVALAVGAKAAAPDRMVVLYTGDGSFGFNAIELDTANRNHLDIKIVIHNDMAWGICKSTQELLYEATSSVDLGMVNYELWAAAMGGKGYLLKEEADIEHILNQLLAEQGITCINAMVDETSYAPGTEEFNKALEKMK